MYLKRKHDHQCFVKERTEYSEENLFGSSLKISLTKEHYPCKTLCKPEKVCILIHSKSSNVDYLFLILCGLSVCLSVCQMDITGTLHNFFQAGR